MKVALLDRTREALERRDALVLTLAALGHEETIRRMVALLESGEGDPAARLVAAVHEMCNAVGLTLAAGRDVPADVAAKAAALDQARADKDYAAADALRAELQADGWTVETTKDGTTVR